MIDVPKDIQQLLSAGHYPEALPSLENEALQGNTSCAILLAEIYRTGRRGVKANFEQAVRWYTNYLKIKYHPHAVFHLAKFYFFGRGVVQNQLLAYRLMRSVTVKEHHPVGRLVTGMILLLGQVVKNKRGAGRILLRSCVCNSRLSLSNRMLAFWCLSGIQSDSSIDKIGFTKPNI